MQISALFLVVAPLSAALRMGAPAVAPSRTGAVSMAAQISNKMVWVNMVPTSELKPGTVSSGFQYGIEVAVVCDKGGGIYGLSNKMPPTGQPTTFASIEGNDVVEPVTGTKYNLKTGKQVGPWCPYPIGKLIIGRVTTPQNMETYKVRKSGGNVQALINVNAKAQFETSYWRGILDAQGKVDGGYY